MTHELDLLQSASYEIKVLRMENELMKARLEMFDTLMQLFHTEPANQSRGVSPDLAYEIDRHVESLKK